MKLQKLTIKIVRIGFVHIRGFVFLVILNNKKHTIENCSFSAVAIRICTFVPLICVKEVILCLIREIISINQSFMPQEIAPSLIIASQIAHCAEYCQDMLCADNILYHAHVGKLLLLIRLWTLGCIIF